MDLKDRKPTEDAQPLDLIDPETQTPLQDGDGKQCRIWLFGEDSERMQRRQRELAAVRANAARRTGEIILTPAQVERDRIETAAICTHKMENVTYDGEPVSNQDQFRTVYRELRWVLEQAERFVADRRNFIKSQSSS